MEKKPETVPVESILDPPGRESRPDRVSLNDMMYFVRIVIQSYPWFKFYFPLFQTPFNT